MKKKPRTVRSLRGKSGKASGGQEGHAGGTLRQVADPDRVVAHTACVCEHCRLPLDPKSPIAVEKRQVFDLPERPLQVTEHQAAVYQCAHCRGVTKADFPEGVRVRPPPQYGERFRAAAIYLNVPQLIPEDRTAQALSDLFGAPLICPASVVAWVGKKAEQLTAVYRCMRARAPPMRRSAISTRRAMKSPASCNGCARLRAYPSPSTAPERGAVPEDFEGDVVVHDHFLPYRRMDAVEHAFCNAHILRELEGVIELDAEKAWAEPMREVLLEANFAVLAAREAGKKALPPARVEAFVERYWAAVRMGLAFHRALPELKTTAKGRGRTKHRPGYNLLERLRKFKTETLRFLHRFRRALHQQPGRPGSEDDEGPDENLRVVPNPGGRADFRAPQVRRFDREKKPGSNILQILTATPEELMQSLAV